MHFIYHLQNHKFQQNLHCHLAVVDIYKEKSGSSQNISGQGKCRELFLCLCFFPSAGAICKRLGVVWHWLSGDWAEKVDEYRSVYGLGGSTEGREKMQRRGR